MFNKERKTPTANTKGRNNFLGLRPKYCAPKVRVLRCAQPDPPRLWRKTPILSAMLRQRHSATAQQLIMSQVHIAQVWTPSEVSVARPLRKLATLWALFLPSQSLPRPCKPLISTFHLHPMGMTLLQIIPNVVIPNVSTLLCGSTRFRTVSCTARSSSRVYDL